MTIAHPLPARVVPLAGESLTSLLRRTAQAMGYEGPGRIRGLLTGEEDVPTNVNLLGPGKALDRLARLSQMRSANLRSMTFHHFAEQLVLGPRGTSSTLLCDSKTVLRYFLTATSPVCPRCLDEDPVPYERLLWSLRPLPVCQTHQCLLLTQCPDCRRPLRHQRSDTLLCACGHSLSRANVVPISSRAAESFGMLERLLQDQASLVPGMSAAATFWWAERLAAATAKTPAWLEEVTRRLGVGTPLATDALAWLAAAEILSDWPRQLEAFLGVFQQVAKHRTTSTGVSRRFGLLLREAAHLEQLEYAVPADALRDYLVRHYTAGHLNGKICLFRDDKARSKLGHGSWISQTAAAKQLGLRSGAIAPLIAQGILEGQLHEAGQRGRCLGLVSRSSVAALQRDLDQAVCVCAAAKRLGVGRHAVLSLIRDGVLPRAVRTSAGWKIPLKSVEALEKLCERLPLIDAESPDDWISLRQATRIGGPSGLNMSRIVKRIRDESLGVLVTDRKQGLNGIAIRRTDLTSAQGELRDQTDPTSHWSLHRTAQNLFPEQSMKVRTLEKWIDQGLLRVEVKGWRRVITAEEIRRFRAEYCLAREAAQVLGISRSTLSRWEQQGRIRPVYGKRVTLGAGFSLYCRADVERRIASRA